jgi:8-oxo-dGTP pyrophosphatase MutT (NUDIX family)
MIGAQILLHEPYIGNLHSIIEKQAIPVDLLSHICKKAYPGVPMEKDERRPIDTVNPELSADELVAIVDRSNRVTGSAPRAVMRREGLIHRATYILVFDSKGRLFVQDRTMTKDIFPGYRDFCTGGVVLAGEDYEASAVRELEEELGVKGVPLESHFDFYGEYAGQRVWGRVFSCVTDGPFALQPEEVAGGAFYTLEEVKGLMAFEPCTPDGVYVLERYLQGR